MSRTNQTITALAALALMGCVAEVPEPGTSEAELFAIAEPETQNICLRVTVRDIFGGGEAAIERALEEAGVGCPDATEPVRPVICWPEGNRGTDERVQQLDDALRERYEDCPDPKPPFPEGGVVTNDCSCDCRRWEHNGRACDGDELREFELEEEETSPISTQW